MSHPIEIIPVLDIAGGMAVHARGGVRERYEPVRSVLLPGASGDALKLARAYRDRYRPRRCYVADLDAIAGKPPQLELLAALGGPHGFGGGLVIDAGVSTADQAARIVALGQGIVVGLENLRSLALLTVLAERWRVVFSIDLRDGAPLRPAELARDPRSRDALTLARAAAEAEVAEVLILDLARVGTSVGPDVDLLARVRGVLPDAGLLAGGGIRNASDLSRLAEAGCDGALVATALHAGGIPPRD
jgi:phosphoribosylformimino-5-aminoimidazole carboxamide ribotide isomerase